MTELTVHYKVALIVKEIVSGTIVPLAKLYHNHFSDYEEPSEWRENVSSVIDAYRAMKSKKSLYKLVGKSDEHADAVRQDCIEVAWNLLQSPMAVLAKRYSDNIVSDQPIDILGDGHFIFEEE